MAESKKEPASLIGCDEKKRDRPATSANNAKDERNASNNSSAVKKKQNETSKCMKSSPSTINAERCKSSARSQSARRTELLEDQRGDAYVYNENTQTFLNFLTKNNVDVRDVKSKVFKNQLMLSETMEEVPSSFAKNWLMLVCPAGSRCLVVARRGYTGAYTRTGYHIISHSSNLPMGNKMFQGFGACILDCIYCNETQTYYVLDLMCWDGQSYYEYPTQTRLKFLQDKVWEYDLSHPSEMNPYPFVPLKTFTPTKTNIRSSVMAAPYLIDGLLFIYKHATYQPGNSPFVLWLTLDHLPSKLKIEIPEMGIITAVSYKDPVSLALVHGVSPAIISQVYPAYSRGYPPFSPLGNKAGHQYYPEHPIFVKHLNQESQMLDHPMAGFKQGYFSHKPRQPTGPIQDDLVYLSDKMMNCKISHGRQRPSSQYDHHMASFRAPFYDNISNNNMFKHNHFDFQMDYLDWNSFEERSYLSDTLPDQQMKSKDHNTLKLNWDEPHKVMNSQWMMIKPENFECNYLACICPVAKRRILVAANGSTCTYNKYGKLIESFTSSLPCGNPSQYMKNSAEMVILDCLWSGALQKFYVIDLLYWRQHSLYESEAEFRFFWLTDLLSNVIIKSGKKEYSLEVLPKYSCTQEDILAALCKTEYKVDGLLFFDKTGNYSLTSSCNALWLKPDMLEEVLGYPCPSNVLFKATTTKEWKQRNYFNSSNA
ncbi:uncharacterized protein LOC106064420 [Biomphalaria glabrata]|uniref:Snurportin-1 n=1 Tax=Biomphalaria glabrata TaxID=6526 RepID=A0A9U8E908_BIOGL|nr:uncharacterized protein LOC106064420 [Biomphalaria glabrata]KAI8774723.1 snurportin-1 [Biomphalaria glabrata]